HHRDPLRAAYPLAVRLDHGDALGADGQPVAGALAVAARDDAPVLRLQGGADEELREGRMGVLAGGDGGLDQFRRSWIAHGFDLRSHNSTPAMEALIRVTRKPANSARGPNWAISPRRVGAMPPMPPIWMPIDATFAKPVRAYVASTLPRGL